MLAACGPRTRRSTPRTFSSARPGIILSRRESPDAPLAGADGIRSAVRPFVTGSSAPPTPCGESAYRASVPLEALRNLGHPLVADGALAPHMSGIMGGTRRIIAYPVRGGTLLNLVCYVPDVQLSEATSERWTAPGDTDALLDAFAPFAKPWRDMLACVLWLQPRGRVVPEEHAG
jgi:salicylate hydroxylase